jgi:hypothetical protein
MKNSANCRQLAFSRFATPLAEASTRNKVDGDGSAKLIPLHKIYPPTADSLKLRSFTQQLQQETEDGTEEDFRI